MVIYWTRPNLKIHDSEWENIAANMLTQMMKARAMQQFQIISLYGIQQIDKNYYTIHSTYQNG